MKALASRDPQRVAQMQSAAMDVESAACNIASLTTLSGTVGNSLLFSTVITHYQGKLDQLDVAIQLQESTFLEEVRSKSGISRTETFSLYWWHRPGFALSGTRLAINDTKRIG